MTWKWNHDAYRWSDSGLSCKCCHHVCDMSARHIFTPSLRYFQCWMHCHEIIIFQNLLLAFRRSCNDGYDLTCDVDLLRDLINFHEKVKKIVLVLACCWSRPFPLWCLPASLYLFRRSRGHPLLILIDFKYSWRGETFWWSPSCLEDAGVWLQL